MSEQNTKPSLDLYPPPGIPSDPPAWDDIERLALHYPAARQAVTMVRRGEWTQEQALIRLVYALASAYQSLFHAEVERRMSSAPVRSSFRDGGSSV